MGNRVVLLSIPQLRQKDVTPGCLASLEALEQRGGIAVFQPAFPCLPASSFATIVTGTGPYEHGLIGDAFFDRARRKVVTRPFHDADVGRPKLWERLRAARPGATTMAWFTPNLHGAAVDRAAWVDPDGGLRTQPAELAEALTGRFGPYPWPRTDPAGEPLRLEATGWILKTAASQIAEAQPDLAIVRVPFLGQVARRYGPDGREASRGVRALEGVLKPFLESLPPATLTVAVTESVSTPVTNVLAPNVVLRGLGLLALAGAEGGGLDVDLEKSAAFAVADHQLCHIYLNDPGQAGTVAAAFSGEHSEGIASVASGARRAALGLDHPRSGDVVLVARPDSWFSPAWWMHASERPRDLAAGSGLAHDAPRDASHILGSLGAPPPTDDYLGVLVASSGTWLGGASRVAARDLAGLLAGALGIPATG